MNIILSQRALHKRQVQLSRIDKFVLSCLSGKKIGRSWIMQQSLQFGSGYVILIVL